MAAINIDDDPLTFAEVSREADYYDDWLFASAKRYKHINMYETDKSISAAEWHGAGSSHILVGTNESSNNELLMYRVPEVVNDEEDRLSKNRELSIAAAAFCDGPCRALMAAPHSFKDPNTVARTEGGSTKLFIYSLPDETNSSTIGDIQLSHTFDLFNHSAYPPTAQLFGTNSLVCSTSLYQFIWCDVSTHKQVEVFCNDEQSLKEPTSSLLCTDNDNVCIASGVMSGHTISVDRRTPKSYISMLIPALDKGMHWSLCGTRASDLVLLSDNNELCLGDMGKPGTVKLRCTLEAPIWTRRNTNFTSRLFGDFLSVSGKDNKVRIYNLNQAQDGAVLQPIFTHDGHLPDVQGGDMPSITTHSWNHMGNTRIASASDTGQLHIWMFAQDNG